MRKALLAFLLLAALPAAAKSLFWRSLDVTARLDSSGRLHVRERQAMVFDGDWNGGERTFNLRQGQTLTFEGMSRIEDGKEIPMLRGDLAEVDRYDFTSPSVLRWRSRLPSDPPFEHREIVYDLKYVLAGILIDHGHGDYELAHDFVFPDRAGAIQHLSIQVDFDPSWQNVSQVVVTEGVVPPGLGYVVKRRMHYGGGEQVEATSPPLSRTAGGFIAAVFIAGIAFLIFLWYAGEQEVGRFAPLIPASQIDSAWIAEHLLVFPPEVAGAAWDDSVGPPEVAAVLARMAQEKKIETSAQGKVLTMRLLVDRDELQGYEKQLIGKLFFSGATETDTERVRKHYASTGFNPGSIIEKGLEPQLQKLPSWNQKQTRYNWWRPGFLLLAAAALLFAGAVMSEASRPVTFASAFLSIFMGVFGGVIAAVNARALQGVGWRLLVASLFNLPITLIAISAALNAGARQYPVVTPLGLGFLALALWAITLEAMRITDGPEKIAFRKRLASARQYFIEQLSAREPQLQDAWFPYLLAFGLGSNVDRWFRAYSAPSTSSSPSSWSSSPSSSSSSWSGGSSSSGWTGGGGTFGGAGATGTWAVAAGALASGVSAPSSSSSGGGGGGGGSSSSGGGGGGGW